MPTAIPIDADGSEACCASNADGQGSQKPRDISTQVRSIVPPSNRYTHVHWIPLTTINSSLACTTQDPLHPQQSTHIDSRHWNNIPSLPAQPRDVPRQHMHTIFNSMRRADGAPHPFPSSHTPLCFCPSHLHLLAPLAHTRLRRSLSHGGPASSPAPVLETREQHGRLIARLP